MLRHPRKKLDAHLEFIRTLPSVIHGHGHVEAAHIRMGSPLYGKRLTGMAEKPDDMWVVPLASSVHLEQHRGSERNFWVKHGINPLILAALLWLHSGDEDAATTVIRNARSLVQ